MHNPPLWSPPTEYGAQRPDPPTPALGVRPRAACANRDRQLEVARLYPGRQARDGVEACLRHAYGVHERRQGKRLRKALAMIYPLLYQRMIEQARGYALFILDPSGRIMSWNLGAERLKGYAPEEIIGRHFSVFYTREAVDSDWPAHELHVATVEGHFEDEGWRVRKDGSRFWANVVITGLRDDDGKLLGFSKIVRDLTERRIHEDALRQSEQRFRLLVDAVQDYAIFMLEPEGMVVSWNPGAERIKGYRRDEIVGTHFSHFFTEEDIARGKRFWARVVLTAVHDDEGHLRGFAKVTQDLTERRHAQNLDKAANNVNEFIAMLAHELRNPLAPIK